MTMRHVDLQFQLFMARAQYWTALANSGAYKTVIKMQRGTDEKSPDGRIIFRDLTDEEKLEHCLATAQRHIQIASEFADTIAEFNSKQYGDCNRDR